MDSTINQTSSSPINSTNSTPTRGTVELSMLSTLTITGSVTIVMNIFVLAVIWRFTWMRSNANLIIASMAVTDLIAGTSALISGVVKWGHFFTVGPKFCLVYNIVDVTVAFASLQHVMAVNLERYIAIVKPLKYKKIFTRRAIYAIVVIMWIWSLGLALMYVLNTVISDSCLLDVPIRALWTMISLTLNYPLPLLFIICIYAHIVIIIIRQLRFLKTHSSGGNVRIKSKQFQMIKSVASIFAAYLVCWAPTFSVLLLVNWSILLGIDLDLSNYVMMFYFVEILSYANSLVNPAIYFLGSRSFQRAARKMFGMKDSVGLVASQGVDTTNTGDFVNKKDEATKF